jgi:hypothetical protein
MFARNFWYDLKKVFCKNSKLEEIGSILFQNIKKVAEKLIGESLTSKTLAPVDISF